MRNDGTLPFLPDEAVIEVTATCRRRPCRRPVGRVAPDMAGLIAHVSAYEELRRRRRAARRARAGLPTLLAHPLIGQHDRATQLTDTLIAGNRQYLAWAR